MVPELLCRTKNESFDEEENERRFDFVFEFVFDSTERTFTVCSNQSGARNAFSRWLMRISKSPLPASNAPSTSSSAAAAAGINRPTGAPSQSRLRRTTANMSAAMIAAGQQYHHQQQSVPNPYLAIPPPMPSFVHQQHAAVLSQQQQQQQSNRYNAIVAGSAPSGSVYAGINGAGGVGQQQQQPQQYSAAVAGNRPPGAVGPAGLVQMYVSNPGARMAAAAAASNRRYMRLAAQQQQAAAAGVQQQQPGPSGQQPPSMPYNFYVPYRWEESMVPFGIMQQQQHPPPIYEQYTLMINLLEHSGGDDFECRLECHMNLIESASGHISDYELSPSIFHRDDPRHYEFSGIRPDHCPDRVEAHIVVLHRELGGATPTKRVRLDHGTLLERVVDKQEFGDCTLMCDGKEIKVYKGLLATYSPVFASMFEHDTKESQTNQVEINDCDYETLLQMVRFCYSGKEPRADLAMDLFAMAEKYQIEKLRTIALAQISRQITAENALDVLILADLHGESRLKMDAKRCITENAIEIAHQPQFRSLAANRFDLLSELWLFIANELVGIEQQPLPYSVVPTASATVPST